MIAIVQCSIFECTPQLQRMLSLSRSSPRIVNEELHTLQINNDPVFAGPHAL